MNDYETLGDIERIYVAGPYGRRNGFSEDQCQVNTDTACVYGAKIIAKGHIPFVPHLYHYIHVGMGVPLQEDDWLKICLVEVRLCNSMFMLPGWTESKGALRELAEAKKIGIHIYYSMDEIPHNKKMFSILPA